MPLAVTKWVAPAPWISVACLPSAPLHPHRVGPPEHLALPDQSVSFWLVRTGILYDHARHLARGEDPGLHQLLPGRGEVRVAIRTQ